MRSPVLRLRACGTVSGVSRSLSLVSLAVHVWWLLLVAHAKGDCSRERAGDLHGPWPDDLHGQSYDQPVLHDLDAEPGLINQAVAVLIGSIGRLTLEQHRHLRAEDKVLLRRQPEVADPDQSVVVDDPIAVVVENIDRKLRLVETEKVGVVARSAVVGLASRGGEKGLGSRGRDGRNAAELKGYELRPS